MINDPNRKLPNHGGDLGWAEQRYGRPADGWVDLSTGINPWPYPLPDIPPDAWARLPDSAAMDRLIAEAARCYGAPGPDTVAAASGTQALIQLLPGLWPARTVAIVSPTYGEHAMAWRDGGHEVVACADLPEAARRGDIVVVTNPNNPDGREFPQELLDRIADERHAQGGALIVDEAFADLNPENSVAPAADRPGRLVLRSFGKFYGLAGLRLGFAIAEPQMVSRIRQALGPWPVSGPALAVGGRALADRSWATETRRRLTVASEAQCDLLRRSSLEIVGGTALFVLAAHPDAESLQDRLGRAGIHVRRFQHRPDWLRFGLPPDHDAAQRLEAALHGR